MTFAALASSALAVINVTPANTPDPQSPALKPGPTATPPVEIRDIAPPIDVFPYPLWVVILAGCVVAAVLGVLIWLLVRWLRKPPKVPPLLPREVAL
jgi:hypothetical protein